MSEPKHDRWGRYILPHPLDPDTSKPWTRATTLAETLNDQYGLTSWKMRTTVLGLVARPDLLDLAYASDAGDKQQLDELCEDAIKAAKGDEKSHKGTALHKFTARLDAGNLSRSPRQWQEHLDAYMAFKDTEGIQTHPKFIERITVVPELSVAGTMDRIVKHKGEAKIADLKTGGIKYDGMKIHIQLALYAHGYGLWDNDNAVWEDMPKVSQTEGLVMHLPAEPDKDGNMVPPKLYPVDLELGWKMAQVAFMVRGWRKTKLVAFGDDDETVPEWTDD